MKRVFRGFRFSLEAPLLLAGWELEAAKRAVAAAHQALLESEGHLESLQQQRHGLLSQGRAVRGSHLDLSLRELQLRCLADIEQRVVDARLACQARRGEWTAAVEHCSRRQRHLEGLNDARTQQHAAFELEQSRQDARRADDDWLMRRGTTTINRERA